MLKFFRRLFRRWTRASRTGARPPRGQARKPTAGTGRPGRGPKTVLAPETGPTAKTGLAPKTAQASKTMPATETTPAPKIAAAALPPAPDPDTFPAFLQPAFAAPAPRPAPMQGPEMPAPPEVTVDEIEALIAPLRSVPAGHRLVRFGPHGDGGYILPDDLDGVIGCLGLGVGRNIDFEFEIAERGIPVTLADGTVAGLPRIHPGFRFVARNVGRVDNDREVTIARLAADGFPKTGDLILKMDIEGGEFAAIEALPDDVLARFRIITLEVHWLTRILMQNRIGAYRRFFDRLTAGHAVVHLHPNNAGPVHALGAYEIPRLMEFTFLRRDRLGDGDFGPPPPDAPNIASRPPLALPACWRRTPD
ncbi:FkbM family methyltransferase [Prosthecodimorpha staleyi]|uniref:FkbM family methyltransferase n=1 Tax=Prosthecodimorpha staleyi TaxID=2840188 RepID=A0A947D6G9_9HYPH|nr:FkbM family methyltransferase [Prosthecodimorpha staleyi]MBT9290456.1 FkbM family methyltransferase [Prosthecodimorpha staleyi]